jgi:hypothetical protein
MLCLLLRFVLWTGNETYVRGRKSEDKRKLIFEQRFFEWSFLAGIALFWVRDRPRIAGEVRAFARDRQSWP